MSPFGYSGLRVEAKRAMEDYSRFIARVSEALRAQRYSVRQLALAVGLDPSYLTRVLSRERNPPADEHISKIARFLQLDEDGLLMDAGRLPMCLRATGPLDETDMERLRSVVTQITRRHRRRQSGEGGHASSHS